MSHADITLVDAVEIFKDPIGHYRHFSVIIGRLVRGSLRVGQVVVLPAVDGSEIAAHIGGFAGLGPAPRDAVTAAQTGSTTLGLLLSKPTIPRAVLPDDLTGLEVRLGTDSDVQQTYARATQPALRPLIWHEIRLSEADRRLMGLSPTAVLPCWQCYRCVNRRADLRAALPVVLNDPRPAVAAAARSALERYAAAAEA